MRDTDIAKALGMEPCDDWIIQRDFPLEMINLGCKHHLGKCYPKDNCPNYSGNIAAAWEVHKAAARMVFSKRLQYYALLAQIVSERVKAEVAYPDVFNFVEPQDFCAAFLKARQQ